MSEKTRNKRFVRPPMIALTTKNTIFLLLILSLLMYSPSALAGSGHIKSVSHHSLNKSKPAGQADKLTNVFQKLTKVYSKTTTKGIKAIYYLFNQGYPYRAGFYSAVSLPDYLIQRIYQNPVTSFDILLKAYPLIKKAMDDDRKFYTMISFYIEAISDTDFNWEVKKNPNHLQGQYNEYSKVIVTDRPNEATYDRPNGAT